MSDAVLAELREVRKSLDRIGDRMTLLVPASPATLWDCGHRHWTRDEAIACKRTPLRSPCADDCTHPPHHHREPFPAG